MLCDPVHVWVWCHECIKCTDLTTADFDREYPGGTNQCVIQLEPDCSKPADMNSRRPLSIPTPKIQQGFHSDYSVCIDTYIYIYTHIHTYMHACMHACMHAYIHTYIQTDRQTDRHTYIYIYIYIHVYRGSIGIMEKNMETTIMSHLGVIQGFYYRVIAM